MTDDKREPPALLLKWDRPGQVQIAITFPTLVVLLFLRTSTLFRQPIARGALYRVFWGSPAPIWW